MKKGIIVTAITLFLSGTGARAQVVSAVPPFRPHQTAVAPSVAQEPFVAAQAPIVQPVVVRRTYVRRQNYVRRPRGIDKSVDEGKRARAPLTTAHTIFPHSPVAPSSPTPPPAHPKSPRRASSRSAQLSAPPVRSLSRPRPVPPIPSRRYTDRHRFRTAL